MELNQLHFFTAPSTPLAPHSWGELGVSFCHVFLHNSLMNILQKIFTDHFEEMIYLQHPRDSVIENVEKMINCGNPAFGGAMYTCPCCGIFKFVPFRCHSRFCPTCGNMYSIDRTTSMSFKLIAVRHRHCVFTIDEILRDFFSRTAPYWIAFFTLSTVLSPACSLKPISPKTLPLVLLWFSILLAGI